MSNYYISTILTVIPAVLHFATASLTPFLKWSLIPAIAIKVILASRSSLDMVSIFSLGYKSL